MAARVQAPRVVLAFHTSAVSSPGCSSCSPGPADAVGKHLRMAQVLGPAADRGDLHGAAGLEAGF